MISFKPIPAAAVHHFLQRFPQTLEVPLNGQNVQARYFGTESDHDNRCIATLFCQFEDPDSRSTVRIRERVHRRVIREETLMREVVESVIRDYFSPRNEPSRGAVRRENTPPS